MPADFDAARATLRALIDISELLLRTTAPRSALDEIVALMRTALPLSAVIVVESGDRAPFAWCSAGHDATMARAEGAARAALEVLRGAAPAAELGAPAGLLDGVDALLSLPLVRRDGVVSGAITVATPPTEEAVFFVAGVARGLGFALEIADAAAGPGAASSSRDELAEVLLSSLDCATTVRGLARIVATHFGSGCVVEIREEDAPLRITDAPSLPDATVAKAHDCVSDAVVRTGAPVTAQAADRPEVAALGVEWILCVPIGGRGEVLGTLTVVGSSSDPPLTESRALDLGRLAGLAVANGRRYERAVTARRQKEEVLSTVSHDLKNPLGVILMTAARILRTTPVPDRRASARRDVEAIERAATRMRGLVTDVLDVSAIEDGALAVLPRRCDARLLVTQSLDATAPFAAAAGVGLDEESRALDVWADPDRIVQVLVNLIGNAIKFTPRGGSVLVTTERREIDCVFSVADTGRGIAADELPHVFDRYWQARREGTGKKTGSGLGLAICKAIVELSHGRIWAESDLGVGTRVGFTVPAARPP